MQQTRFDRWLREKFVLEIHIFTMREAEKTPKGLWMRELPEAPGRRFRNVYVTRNSKLADRFIRDLRENSMMFTTRVVDREGWLPAFLAPKGKSFTWCLVSFLLFLSFVSFVGHRVHILFQDPEFRAQLLDAIEVLKN